MDARPLRNKSTDSSKKLKCLRNSLKPHYTIARREKRAICKTESKWINHRPPISGKRKNRNTWRFDLASDIYDITVFQLHYSIFVCLFVWVCVCNTISHVTLGAQWNHEAQRIEVKIKCTTASSLTNNNNESSCSLKYTTVCLSFSFFNIFLRFKASGPLPSLNTSPQFLFSHCICFIAAWSASSRETLAITTRYLTS